MSSDKIVASNNDLINKKSVALLSRLESNKSKKLIKDANTADPNSPFAVLEKLL